MFRYFDISMIHLNINDGIRVRLCYFRANTKALFPNDVAEDFAGELLALIMADDANLNLLLLTEVLMIVHFTCDKGISTL